MVFTAEDDTMHNRLFTRVPLPAIIAGLATATVV
jgi:hypothetical protein